MTSPSPQPADSLGSKAMPAIILAVGTMLAVMTSLASVGMLREGLHVNCTYGTEGEAAGAWFCADGIGYIVPGLGLMLLALAPLIIAFLCVVLLRTGAARAGALLVVGGVAAITTPGVIGLFTATRGDALPAGQTWPGVWWAQVGLAGILLIAATLVGVVALLLLRAGEGTAVSRVRLALTGVSVVLFVAAFLAQPGMAAAISASAACLLAALLPLFDLRFSS